MIKIEKLTYSVLTQLMFTLIAGVVFTPAFAQERGNPGGPPLVGVEGNGLSEKKVSNTHFIFEAHGTFSCHALKISNALDCEKAVNKRLVASAEVACAKKGFHAGPARLLWTKQVNDKIGYARGLVVGNGIAIDCRDTAPVTTYQTNFDR